MEINAFNNAVAGIQRGMNGMARSAAELASSKQLQGQADATGALVENKVNSQLAQASVKVLKSADETLGTLLDIKA